MPKYSPNYEEMDSLHGEVKPPESEHEDTTDEQLAEGETAIVPMKVLMGKDGAEPHEGDEIVLKVVALHGNEAEVAYAPKEPETKPKHSMSSDDELDALEKESY